MRVEISNCLCLSLGRAQGLPHAIHLDRIKAPRPFGCGLMQLSAKTMALAMDTYPVLIVEDDALPTEWWEPGIEIPEDADLVYLGWSRYRPDANERTDGWDSLTMDGPLYVATELDNVVRVKMTLATHAILYLTRKGLEWSREANVQCAVQRRPSDILMAETLDKVTAYGLRRPPYFQGPEGRNRNAKATYFKLPDFGQMNS